METTERQVFEAGLQRWPEPDYIRVLPIHDVDESPVGWFFVVLVNYMNGDEPLSFTAPTLAELLEQIES